MSKNLLGLLRVMIASHQAQDSFLENLSRLIKTVMKDMITSEKTIQSNYAKKDDKKDAPPVSELDKTTISIKRTISLSLVKCIQDVSNQDFRKNLTEFMFKLNQG